MLSHDLYLKAIERHNLYLEQLCMRFTRRFGHHHHHKCRNYNKSHQMRFI